MDLRFNSLLIVTYGRSGSTLLQGVINSIDGMLIRGENENFIEGLYDGYRRLTLAIERRPDLERTVQPSHHWYGAAAIDLDLYISNCEKMVKSVLLAEQYDNRNICCYGFKEIRYFQVKDFNAYLEFLEKIFPNICFIFNTRNRSDVLQSAWWKNKRQASVNKLLNDIENNFHRYALSHPKHSFEITYEDVISKSSKLKELFSFLGAPYSESTIECVLSTPHSFDQKSFNPSHDPRIRYSNPNVYQGRIAYCIIDKLPKKIRSGQPFDFSGVVVLTDQATNISAIEVIPYHDNVYTTFGLASPEVTKSHPEVPSSKTARFEVRNYIIDKPGQIGLIIKLGNGEKFKVCSIMAPE